MIRTDIKILQIAYRFAFPPTDGCTIGLWNLIEDIASLGIKVKVLALNTNKHYIDYNSVKNSIPYDIEICPIDINTDIKYFDALKNLLFSSEPYNAIRFYSKELDEKLSQVLKSEKFDIVLIESPYLSYYIPTVRANSNALVAMRLYNIESEIWERVAGVEKNILKKIYLNLLCKRIKALELRALNQADVFVPVTQRDGDFFVANGIKKPMFVAQIGINNKFVNKNTVKYDSIDFYFIGALDWQPNIQGLLWFLENIWCQVIKTQPEQIFTVAGRNASNDLVQKLKQHPNVNYIGEVPDAIEFMKSNSVMLVPLLSGSGMRVKIIEGMAAGSTIISTSIGAEGIDVTDKKNIIIADTPEEFINAMNKITTAQISQIGNNAIEFIKENYEAIAIAKKLLEFYSNHL